MKRRETSCQSGAWEARYAMSKMKFAVLCLAVCSCNLWAQASVPGDAKGCVENKVVSRMPGWLSAHGVDGACLVPAGFGDTRPVAENKDEEGRQKNRRVDLIKIY